MRNGPNEQWYGFSDQIILYFADGLTTLPMRMQISGATFALDSEIIVSNLQRFVGSFSKLRKARINLVMSVRPRRITRPPLDDFHEIWYLSIFRMGLSVDKIQVSLKYEKNNG